MTLYDLLELPINANEKEIKAAYKKIAKKYHPDVDGGDQEKFVRINNAYSILSNPIQKQKYDTMLSSSSAKTFEIFAKGAANPDTYYSDSDLWHKSFMKNNQITTEWNFEVPNENNNFYSEENYKFSENNFYDQKEENYNDINKNFYSLSFENQDPFLDFEISSLFYLIFRNTEIDSLIFNRLFFRDEFVCSNLPPEELINFYKTKYNYNNWLERKKNLDIKIVLEATELELRTGMEIKVPLNIKCINEGNFQQIWYARQKKYILNIPPKTKNGEIMEFFDKGHSALGWKGDLIVIIKIVPIVNDRIKILDENSSTNFKKLWF